MRNLYNTKTILRTILTGCILMIFVNANAQIKIGTNGNIISPASLLELESTNQGLLLPRLADTAAINALSPPNGMLIYLTKAPAVGLYVRKVTGWEYLTGSLAGNGNFNSLTVANTVTAGTFSGPLNGNATSATIATTATNATNSTITNDLTTTNPTFPTFVTQTPGNTGIRTSSTNLSYVPQTGILTAKGFNGPLVGDVTGNALTADDADNSANIRVNDDNSNPATVYPTWVSGITGPFPPRVTSTKLAFKPSTGELTATIFKGSLDGNAATATTVSGSVAAINGGTGQNIYTPGDLLYAQTSINLERLPAGPGRAGRVLRVLPSGLPSWELAGAGTVTGITSPNATISIIDPTVAPQIDISASYPGQNSIVRVGALAAGSLANGFTPVNVPQGGTGLASLPANDVLIGNGAAAITVPAGSNTAGNVLTSRGAGLSPQWTLPAGTGDMHLNGVETVTAAKTFNDGTLILKGSGGTATTVLKADANANGTVTFPAGTITVVSAEGAQAIAGNKNFTGTNSFTGSTTLGITSVSNLTVSGNINNVLASTIINGAQDAANASDVTNGTIVRRTTGGNFTAGTITANLAGNANTASLAALATLATTASTSTITNTTTASTYYPTFVANTSGNEAIRVNSTKLTFNPSSGILTATGFVGNLTGNASTVTTVPALFGAITSNGTTNETTITSQTGTGTKLVVQDLPTLNGVIINSPTPPIHSTDPGTNGEIRWDASFMYLYTGAQWKRIPLDATAF